MTNYEFDYSTIQDSIVSSQVRDVFTTVSEILNILIFIIDVTVITLMYIKCRKFIETKVYDDFDMPKKLSKPLEIITIFLGLDALYGVWRLFAILQLKSFIESILPDFSGGIFVYMIIVSFVLPVLSCGVSIYVWNYYQNARKLFFSTYPNGVMPVITYSEPKRSGSELYGTNVSPNMDYTISRPVGPIKNLDGTGTQSPFQPPINAGQPTGNAPSYKKPEISDDDFFGTGLSSAYLDRNTVDEAKLEDLLIQDEPETAEYKVAPVVGEKGDDIFGTGTTSNWMPVADMDDPMLADMFVNDEIPTDNDNAASGGDDDFFGTGASDDYMKRFNTPDDTKISELLIQEEPPKKDE